MDFEFTIKEIVPSDLSRISGIIDVSFPMFFRFFATHSLAEKGQVIVAEAQGMIVGFVKLIDLWLGGKKFGCVLWLAVDPKFRRRGVAGALVKSGIECLKRDDTVAVFASVNRRNFGSLSVFREKGFVRIGFLSLWRIFGRRLFEFCRDIWFAPGEIVLMHD